MGAGSFAEHTANAEQEALKSRLKEKTTALDANMAELQQKVSEAKKVVKLAIPQASWKEFGITDSK